MIPENETPEEKVLREEAEAKANKVELTPEQEDEIIERRLGGKPSEFIKKSEQVVVLSDDDKAKLAEEKRAKAFTTGLAQNWFKQSEYDEYQRLTATGKIEIAKRKFIEENPELSKEAAEETFKELFRIDEDDEVEINEEMKPNAKKKVAISVVEKMADQYVKDKFGNIINAETQYENYDQRTKNEKANAGIISKSVADLPGDMEITIEGVDETFKYKISEEDRKEAEAIFLSDKALLGRKDVKPEEIKENAVLFIKAKNIDKIVSEAVITALEKAKDAYERGEKGIIPMRKDKVAGANLKEDFLKQRGIQLPAEVKT